MNWFDVDDFSLEWWSFELLILLSGLLPNPQLETSVLSVWYVLELETKISWNFLLLPNLSHEIASKRFTL